jgi:hypothetical protein
VASLTKTNNIITTNDADANLAISSVLEKPRTKPQHAKIIVQHDYHDHSRDSRSQCHDVHRPTRGGVTTPFPLKLHEMLENIQADGFGHIISWQPHGRCFVVHKPKEFVDLLPAYFNISKVSSFQRQLNLYGFQRLTRGNDRGGYYHELFLQGKVFLAHSIQRSKVKGTGVRARSNPEQEPSFWDMPWVGEEVEVTEEILSTATPAQELQQILSRVVTTPACSLFFQQEEDNGSFGMPFHDDFVDLFLSSTEEQTTETKTTAPTPIVGSNSSSDVFIDEWATTEDTERFFADFDFPFCDYQLEDDQVFADLLEQIVA